MSKGYFISSSGDLLYFGVRTDKPGLEADNTWYDAGDIPDPPEIDFQTFDRPRFNKATKSWEIVVDAAKPTDDQRVQRAFFGELDDVNKIILEMLFELTNEVMKLKNRNPLTKQQFREYLKGKL